LLVVLDEATSALDGETEANFSDALNSIRGECTIVLIAHRLATVTSADKVVYLEEGRIRAVGTFTEIKNAIPNFASQASLVGL
jgi:ABC-type bacteriocin/lantibiotic exporter with double-glycine peptidase domain